MARLTNAEKEVLIQKATEVAYPTEKWDALRLDLGKAFLKTVKVLSGWQKYADHITTTDRVRLNLHRRTGYTRWGVTCPLGAAIPAKIDNLILDYSSFDLSEHPKMMQVVQKEYDALISFDEAREAFQTDLKKVFRTVNSTTRLIELMPELGQFVPESETGKEIVSVEEIERVRKALNTKAV